MRTTLALGTLATALLVVAGSAFAAGMAEAPRSVHAGVSPVSESVGTPDDLCVEGACNRPPADARADASWGGADVYASSPDCDTAAVRDDPGSTCTAATPTVEIATPTVTLSSATLDGSGNQAPSSSGSGAGIVGAAPSGSPFVFALDPFVAAGLGATGLALLPATRRLLVLLLSPLATRLAPDRLLEDGTRRRIYETIRDEPGVNLKALAARLDVAWGTLLHHVRKLESAHMIVSQRYGKYRRYFLNGGAFTRDERAQMAAMASPSTARVAELIRDHPGRTQRELGLMLGVSPSTVLWHVKRLEEVQLVDAKREGRCVRYYTPGHGPVVFQAAA